MNKVMYTVLLASVLTAFADSKRQGQNLPQLENSERPLEGPPLPPNNNSSKPLPPEHAGLIFFGLSSHGELAASQWRQAQRDTWLRWVVEYGQEEYNQEHVKGSRGDWRSRSDSSSSNSSGMSRNARKKRRRHGGGGLGRGISYRYFVHADAYGKGGQADTLGATTAVAAAEGDMVVVPPEVAARCGRLSSPSKGGGRGGMATHHCRSGAMVRFLLGWALRNTPAQFVVATEHDGFVCLPALHRELPLLPPRALLAHFFVDCEKKKLSAEQTFVLYERSLLERIFDLLGEPSSSPSSSVPASPSLNSSLSSLLTTSSSPAFLLPSSSSPPPPPPSANSSLFTALPSSSSLSSSPPPSTPAAFCYLWDRSWNMNLRPLTEYLLQRNEVSIVLDQNRIVSGPNVEKTLRESGAVATAAAAAAAAASAKKATATATEKNKARLGTTRTITAQTGAVETSAAAAGAAAATAATTAAGAAAECARERFKGCDCGVLYLHLHDKSTANFRGQSEAFFAHTTVSSSSSSSPVVPLEAALKVAGAAEAAADEQQEERDSLLNPALLDLFRVPALAVLPRKCLANSCPSAGVQAFGGQASGKQKSSWPALSSKSMATLFPTRSGEQHLRNASSFVEEAAEKNQDGEWWKCPSYGSHRRRRQRRRLTPRKASKAGGHKDPHATGPVGVVPRGCT